MSEYKLSYYIIESDPIEETVGGGLQIKYILYSTITGQTILVSQSVRDYIFSEQWDNLDKAEYDELIKHKFIVPIDKDELGEIIRENKDIIENESLLYYVIQPTAYCQLGCDYCGQEHTKKNISTSLYDSIVSRIESKLNLSDKYQAVKIGWFGGEPLVGLKQIRDITASLKTLCDKRGLNYSAKIVTNGLSLKPNIYKELVSSLYIREIEVTLDGIAEFHDQRRHTKSKEATFDIIFNNLKDIIESDFFKENRIKLSIRCNVDKRNWEGVSPLIEMLSKNEFHKNIAYFYPIGVYSWGNEAHLGSLTKEEFAEKEIDWIIEMFQAGFRPSLLPGRVKSVCIAVSPSAEMLDAMGNIFNCTEVSYVDKYNDSNYVLGNVKYPDMVNPERPLSDWNDVILSGNKVPCTTCKMLPVCGGACPKSWHEDMRACPSTKFNIKDKLMLSYLTTKPNFLEVLNEI